MKLTVMTYNICSGLNLARQRDLKYAASVIDSVQPDILVLNEVRCRTSDIGDVDQARVLGEMTGYTSVFGKSIDILGGGYGNALLTRLPVEEWSVIHIPDPTPTGEGFYEHRSVLRCRLKAGEGIITVLGTHFGLMPEEQERAVETLCGLIREEEHPAVLMGDLNLTPDAALLKPLFELVQDTSGNGLPLTFPSDKPDIKIDYILYAGKIRAEAARTLDTQCSDHRPLIAQIELL